MLLWNVFYSEILKLVLYRLINVPLSPKITKTNQLLSPKNVFG